MRVKNFIKGIWANKNVKPQDIRRILITNAIKKNISKVGESAEKFVENLAEALNTGVQTIYLSYDRSIGHGRNVAVLNRVHGRLLNSTKGKFLCLKYL